MRAITVTGAILMITGWFASLNLIHFRKNTAKKFFKKLKQVRPSFYSSF
ncbi:hypothetical protein [Geomicrobium sp. JCM 19039]|nr:hypothetical protein [Geomicrobium sp. JCM 19039]